jgi:hypothetical protein
VYGVDDGKELWAKIRGADEIVTWNGSRVAMLVLRRIFGAEHFPIKKHHVGIRWGRHIDLCEVVEEERCFSSRISLSKAVELSFGEDVALRRPVGAGKADENEQRARQIVEYTYRLWRAYREGDGLVTAGGFTLFHPQNRR